MSIDDVVAVGGGALDGLELGELVAQPIELLLDRLVVGDRALDLDAQLLVAADVDRRPHLDHRVEHHGAGVAPSVISISGGAITSTSCSMTARV